MKNQKIKMPDQRPACFGQLDTVFPKREDGLRHTPEECLDCTEKVECLREAVQGKNGMAVREEKLDRAYASGHIGFFERWSMKKKIHRYKEHRGWFSKWLRHFKNRISL